MKTRNYCSWLFFFLLMIGGCKENDQLLTYDTAQSYIYFAYPNPDTRVLEKYMDSVEYNFAVDEDLSLTEKRLAIPVRTSGLAVGQSRNYRIEVDEELSDFDPSLVSVSETIIGSGKLVDTLYITIQRGQALQEKGQQMVLTMVPNESFKVGNEFNRKIRIKFGDVLTEPRWWNTWLLFFGPYHKEVYQKWMQIYYLGADPSPHLTDGTPGPIYYWNNMPSSSTITWYPVTHMYIGVLKKYFEEHVVYPNGDSTKDRILLP